MFARRAANLRDRDPLKHDRMQRVVELLRLEHSRRSQHVDGLRNGRRVDRTVRIAARRRADAELEGLRSRLEAARLVRAEAILSREHDGERPAGAGAAERPTSGR